VLITRSEDDCAEWAVELERRGARPVLLPCITSEPIDTPELRAALKRAITDADWLVLTSRRGVEACARLLVPRETHRHDPPTLQEQGIARGATVTLPVRTCIATVGAATANEARERFGRADLIGGGNAAALGAALIADVRFTPGARVVLALAENAGDALERALTAAGASCARFDVYRTIPAPPAPSKRALSSLGAERVVLASPSAANGFVHQVDLDVPVAIYTIGPSTTAAARALGLAVTAEAREPSLEGILEAMQ
jgi:uroporphyrinogen III methyltransferase / synthase